MFLLLRPVDPPVADEPQSPIMEETSPSAIVDNMLGNLEPEEAIESQPRVDGETEDTQRFAFNTRGNEELPTEALVKQPVEVTQEEAEPEETPSKVRRFY